jgi:hypothetical protein
VTGSRAWTRKIKDGEIDAPKRQPSPEQFFRVRLNPDGTARRVEGPKSLAGARESNPVLTLMSARLMVDGRGRRHERDERCVVALG